MIGWNEGVTNAISYIEENLDKELDIKDIADKAYVSCFLFSEDISCIMRIYCWGIYPKSQADTCSRKACIN